jgi:hypothetical protein
MSFQTPTTLPTERLTNNHERAVVNMIGASTDTYTPTHAMHEHASRTLHPCTTQGRNNEQAWPHEKAPRVWTVIRRRSLGTRYCERS